jgi:thymidylate synthase (FAD)
LLDWWLEAQVEIKETVTFLYKEALSRGIAKEVARAILPEGLTTTKMYMNGSIRSWMHYLDVRLGNGTQKEHTEIAKQVEEVFAHYLPVTYKAWKGD